MARKATKAAGNVFYLARMDTAKSNDMLNSREGASEYVGIDRTRLANIELDILVPYPEEVLRMADAYNSPELCNYHCSKQCPLGKHTVPPIEICELEQLTLRVVSAFKQTSYIKESLIDIAADGIINDDEKSEMQKIIALLDNITLYTQSLKIWVEKNIR